MNITNDPYYSFKCACASFVANYMVGILHPLQLLKTRLQSHDGKVYDNVVPKYQSIIKGLRDIYMQEGVRGLYKGIHLTMLSQAGSSALFFMIYEKRKVSYQISGTNTLSAATYAGIQASIIGTLITQPIWVIKTRVLLNTQPDCSEFKNVIQKTKQIWQQGRYRGFYSGLSINLVLSLTGALQMYSYEGTKLLYEYCKIEGTSWGEKNFVCGGFSKIFTTIITYPFTTVRTRIQQDQYFNQRSQAKYSNIKQIVKKMGKQQGIVGFYKGLTANLLRGIPQRGIYFYFYQILKQLILVPTENANN